MKKRMDVDGMVATEQVAGLRGLMLVRRFTVAALAISAFAILVGVVADNFRATSALDTDSSQEDHVNVGIRRDLAGSLNMTVTNDAPCANYDSSESILELSVGNGALAADCITVKVSTNDVNGYTLNINGPASGNLSGVAEGEAMTAKGDTMAAPAVFALLGTESAWGFAIPSGQIKGITTGFDASYSVLASGDTNTAKYAEVPAVPTTFSKTGRANKLNGEVLVDDIYNIYFAVTASSDLAVDTYTGEVVISGVTNINPSFLPPEQTGERIQTITAANCPTARTRVVDARDGATYWIRKVGDLCWMETNLAYAGGGSNYYGDMVPVMVQGTASADATFTNARYFIPTGANRTSGTANPSPNINGTGQYGYLYNWCAAMGSQAAACQNGAATQPNQGANDGTNIYNVCPAGWRLPTGGNGSELGTLATTFGGNATGMLTKGLYMKAGYWSSGSFSYLGQAGKYWTSTVASSDAAYHLDFMSGSTTVNTAFSKRNGQAVRCVSSATDPVAPVNPTDPDVEGPEPADPATPGSNTDSGDSGNVAVNGDEQGTTGGTTGGSTGGDGDADKGSVAVAGEFEQDGAGTGSGNKVAAAELDVIPLVAGGAVLVAGVSLVVIVAAKRKKDENKRKHLDDIGQDW
ncbi:MAG: hypothetical protein LBM12_02405 [Candidatus Nomurabacteria bacterium]|jgi:uncharacterized protein (TIGR02145 family)|nr:hypothetical protein [Candidatus Nomurabacteria bacterium]